MKEVTFSAASFVLNEFCVHNHDGILAEEVQHRLDASEEQHCVRYTKQCVNNFTGSELTLHFFAPLHKPYSVKYAEMTVLEAE